MKQSIFISTAYCLLLMASCKKAELPAEGQPVFMLSGDLDKLPFGWQAGVDGRYMVADYTTVGAGKLAYRGNLGTAFEPTANGGEQIAVLFIQKDGVDSVLLDVNKTVRTGEFAFATSSGGTVVVEQGLIYQTTISGQQPYKLQLEMGGLFIAQLPEQGFLTGIDSSYVGPAYLQLTDEYSRVSTQTLWVDFIAKKTSGVWIEQNGTSLIAHAFGEKPVNYDWSGGIPVGDTIIEIDSLVSAGTYAVTVGIGGNRFVSNTINFSQDPFKPCHVRADLDFFTLVDSVGLVQNFENGSVIVQYIDDSGELYSSDYAKQTGESYFRINSVEEYEQNLSGDPTKKLAVEFDCTLSNFNRTVSKSLKNVKGVIAVGYPR